MKALMAALVLTGIIGLGLDRSHVENRIETDPDLRADCVMQLLNLEQEPFTAGYIIGTLNYTDRHYGGPCAALEHYRTHGWY